MEDINTLTQKANSGDAVAMRKLGYEYLIGKNIQKDEKKAFQLFRAAVWERSEEHTSELQSRE